MPAYEARRGMPTWAKVLIIVGIAGVLLVVACVGVLGYFGLKFAREMMVQFEPSQDAAGNPVYSTQHFTLAALPDWTIEEAGPFAALRHSPTSATLMVMAFPGGGETTATVPLNQPGFETTTMQIAGGSATVMRSPSQGQAQVALTAPDGRTVMFQLSVASAYFAEAEPATLGLLNTLQWK